MTRGMCAVLQVHDCQDIGPHYAVTLRAWRAAWEARKAEVLKLGYSERFWRKYRYSNCRCRTLPETATFFNLLVRHRTAMHRGVLLLWQ
jgi:cyclopropane fatty-acyl-phospholipid synthase-like methyltransferase